MAEIDTSRDTTILSSTESVCPVCLRRIDAQRIVEGDEVFLRKSCPEHGSFQTVIWRGADSYLSWAGPDKTPSRPPVCDSSISKGCPYDCGLCPDHRQHTCCVILEVTNRCNLSCPVCFADASVTSREDPTLEEIARRCRSLLAAGGPFNIQLSGGEPTLRNDLPEIIAMIRSMGFPFLQLNTNGIRLAKDTKYLSRLKQAGLDCVFLQFDGFKPQTYRGIRGKDLLKAKLAAIRNCGEQQLGVVLVPTLVPNVNTDEIGDILHLALACSPTIRAVHFQPVSYFGRYPGTPRNSDRITIPEVLREIEKQTSGKFHASDFHSGSGENTYCSFQGKFWISKDGGIRPAARPSSTSCCGTAPGQSLVQLGNRAEQNGNGDGARRARRFVAQQWSFPIIPEPQSCNKKEENSGLASLDAFLAENAHALSVSGMAFQDAWNLDLERLRECFLHIVNEDGKLIPLCAYNLTSTLGNALYRIQREDASLCEAFR